MEQKRFFMPVLMLGVFGVLTTEMGVIGMLPEIARHFSVSTTDAALMVSLFALAVGLSGLALPLLLSRFERKRVMLFVLGLFTLGNIIGALSNSFTIALAARTLPAFLHPVYCSLALTLAAETAHSPRDAPKRTSLVLMTVSAGMVAGVPLCSLLVGVVDVPGVMLLFAALCGLAFVATLLLVPHIPASRAKGYGEQLRALKRSVVWLSFAAMLLVNASIYAVYAFISEYLGAAVSADSAQMAALLLTYSLFTIAGTWVGGRALTRTVRLPYLVFPALAIVAYALLTGADTSIFATGSVLTLWGFAAGGLNCVGQNAMTSSMPDAPEFANGLFISLGNFGTTVGTFVGGWFLNALGVSSIPFAGILLTVALLAVVIVRFVAMRESSTPNPLGKS